MVPRVLAASPTAAEAASTESGPFAGAEHDLTVRKALRPQPHRDPVQLLAVQTVEEGQRGKGLALGAGGADPGRDLVPRLHPAVEVTAAYGPKLDGVDRLDRGRARGVVEQRELAEALARDDRAVFGSIRANRAKPPRADQIEAVPGAPSREDDLTRLETLDAHVRPERGEGRAI